MKYGKCLVLASALLTACGGDGESAAASTNPDIPGGKPATLVGERISPLAFTANPYPHIPAQCHIETSRGTQNACQYCHTNGAYQARLGNNNPQAGLEARIGNFQLEYAFGPYDTTTPLPVVNRWENTLKPEALRAVVEGMGIKPEGWDMKSYIRSDNWQAAYDKRPGDPKDWDAAVESPWRLFPGLDPTDLPADSDGFVRSTQPGNAFFMDERGGITGWRAVNFMPYGIFIPMTGSVSGIYIRLPEKFMQAEDGGFDLGVYRQNLDLLERAIQDRLQEDDSTHYLGKAQDVAVEHGLYPPGTEFAHPLHYVDVGADGGDPAVSPFPGTRSRRVKEVRFMYKAGHWNPDQFRPGDKEEGSSIYGRDDQGWVDNGAGWILAGFIEDKEGALRPQTREEMAQCIGCHSGVTATEFPTFTSGTGNTVDSTWALPRKFAGDIGWQEMNYLLYQADTQEAADEVPGRAGQGDPLNRELGRGEFRYFLDTVVGASLYGNMPQAVENVLAAAISRGNDYSADWPDLDTTSAEAFQQAQALRQQLMREFTAKGGYLEPDGTIRGGLLYPPAQDALAAAGRYRQVVVSQRYNLGKDVFPETPVTFRHFRSVAEPLTRVDGTPYQTGEVITERPINLDDPASFNYRVGSSLTEIDDRHPDGTYNPDYLPLLQEPLEYEAPPATEKAEPEETVDWNRIPLSTLPVNLRGVFCQPEGGGFAILEMAGNQRLLTTGKPLPGYGDVELLAVGERYALLQNAGKQEKLRLAGRQAMAASAPAGFMAGALEHVDLKAFRDNAAADPYNLLAMVQPEAVIKNGELAGYRLQPGFEPELFTGAGLQSGDLLLAVNGVDLQSEEQAIGLLQQYAGATRLSLTLQRGDEEINLPVSFKDG